MNQESSHTSARRSQTLPYPELFKMVDNETRTKRGQRCSLFFTGSVRLRWNPIKKQFEVLKIDYRMDGNGPLQIKYPGGCSERHETVHQCLARETRIETGWSMGIRAQVLYQEVIRNKEDSSVIEHIKVFFYEELEYKDRYPFLKTATGSEGGECSKLEWMPLNQHLVDTLFKSHKEPTKRLVAILNQTHAPNDKNMAIALMDITID